MTISVDQLVQAIIYKTDSLPNLSQLLSDDIVDDVVHRLKQEVDRHWFIDTSISLDLANTIIQIGEERKDPDQIALGLMARGDSWRFEGSVEPAWRDLSEAAKYFKKANNPVGWARTCIGRVAIANEMNAIDESLKDIEVAKHIFNEHGEYDRLRRMHNATGVLYLELGDYDQALAEFHLALSTAQKYPDAINGHVGTVYMNIGYAHDHQGDFVQALLYYDQARTIYKQHQQTIGIARAQMNIAFVERRRGSYLRALNNLYDVYEDIKSEPHLHAIIQRDLAACNLRLNRFEIAREFAIDSFNSFKLMGRKNDMSRILLHLAEIETRLGNHHAGLNNLKIAEPIFEELRATSWLVLAQLRRAQITLLMGKSNIVKHDIETIIRYFDEKNYQLHHVEALLVMGWLELNHGNHEQAYEIAVRVLRFAHHSHIAYLRYSAHLLGGRVAEKAENVKQAIRRYSTATRTVDYIQRRLSLSLRANFLHDKLDAFQSLIRLHLQQKNIEEAFLTLEQAKAQILVDYVNQHQAWNWFRASSDFHELMEKLNELRATHNWWTWEFRRRNEYEPENNFLEVDHTQLSLQHDNRQRYVVGRLSQLEREILLVQERLDMYRANAFQDTTDVRPSVQAIQQSLTDDEGVVAYYTDDDNLHAFVIRNDRILHKPLMATIEVIQGVVEKLYTQIDTALTFEAQTMNQRQLRLRRFEYIATQLYHWLVEPLAYTLQNVQDLTIVPYGILHYLPFHLLHDGINYLLEIYRIRIAPATSIITQIDRYETVNARNVILAYSVEKNIGAVLDEADAIYELIGGSCYKEDQANSYSLQRSPGQVLHIAAHGEYRLDQPDLSYIQLADGRLYMSDLFHHDLRYELVTLSACQTGWSNVRPGDEVMGLGHAFLYAGAKAVVTSLWRVDDVLTAPLMQYFYEGLMLGQPKDEALQNAQKKFINHDEWSHPAFWGAFQLIGSNKPFVRSS